MSSPTYPLTDILIIRKAKPDEIPILIDIQMHDGFNHAYYLTGSRIKRLLQRGEIFFIAYLGEHPVGFFAIDIEIRAKIHFLSVRKEFARKGVGSKLLEVMEDKAKHANVNLIYCNIEPNSPGEKFLLKRGYRQVGYFQQRLAKSRDTVILAKQLKEKEK